MSTPTERLVRRYLTSMITAVDHYEEQKTRYAAVKKAYELPGRDPVTATFRAASDPRITEAAALAVWHRDDAAMYAAVITALLAGEPVADIPAQTRGGTR